METEKKFIISCHNLTRDDEESFLAWSKQQGNITVLSLDTVKNHIIVNSDLKLLTQAQELFSWIKDIKKMKPPPSSILPIIKKSTIRPPSELKRVDKTPHTNEPACKKARVDTVSVHASNKAKSATNSDMWTQKYSPRKSEHVIANKLAINQVRDWLRDFPNRKNDKNFMRALLISGVPGIGKTTTAQLLARESGYEIIEFNASDTRSRKQLKQGGCMEIGICHSLDMYAKSVSHDKTLIIMDEVDGMGVGDYGGNQELIKIIKSSNVPIICICNDRQKPNVRSLANYCLDIKFKRPSPDEIVGRLKLIMEYEGFKHVDVPTLKRMFTSVNGDIRHMLNILQMLRRSTDRLDSQHMSMTECRHVELSPFLVLPMIFSAAKRSLDESIDLFFHDYEMIPLFVQENYLRVKTMKQDMDTIDLAANASECISFGDIFKEQAMLQHDWSVLPFIGAISTAIPAMCMRGQLSNVSFPEWLGKNSTRNKRMRLLKELEGHMAVTTLTFDKRVVLLDYLPHLASHLMDPLQQYGKEGISKLLDIMKVYGITREDWDSVFTLMGKDKEVTRIPSQVRATFTRAYNKTRPATTEKHSAIIMIEQTVEDNDDGGKDDQDE